VPRENYCIASFIPPKAQLHQRHCEEGCYWILALLYARIMVSSILNLVAALTACGMFAGSVIVSPRLTP
jgi:hypothetical protein